MLYTYICTENQAMEAFVVFSIDSQGKDIGESGFLLQGTYDLTLLFSLCFNLQSNHER